MAEDNRNKPLYMISVAAELTGMHPQTLRVYESKGLVNPQPFFHVGIYNWILNWLI